MAKYTEFAKAALDLVGGHDNLSHVTHCATRVRITFKSKKATKPELWNQDWINEHMPNLGCAGVVPKSNQVQFIIGPNVADAYHEFNHLAQWDPGNEANGGIVTDVDDDEVHDWKWRLNKFGNFVAPIFMPIVPAFIVGGIILSLKNLAVNYFGMSTDSGTAQLCLAMFDAGFSFLPIYVGMTLSKQLKVPEILGMMLGAVTITSRFASGVVTDFLGIPIYQASYESTIIPIVLGVFFLAFIYKWVKKIVPEALTFFVTPLLVMIICVPVQFLILGPLGNYLSGYVANGVSWMGDHLGFLAQPILSALYPYMVMFGLDKALDPVGIQLIATLGYNNVTSTMGFVSNICIGGTALAVAIALNNKAQKGMVNSFGITALCGVTEPAFYGALISRPRALIGTAIGAVCGGLFAGIVGLRTFVAGGCPGYLTLTFFIDQNGGLHYVWMAIITAVISTVVSFMATYIIMKRDAKAAKDIARIKAEEEKAKEELAAVQAKSN